MQTFLFLLELAGTVAFAVSGAVLGIEKHMDIFGVGLLGITTAVGGGILRDLVVGLTPPRAFQDPMYLLVALGVSVVLFFPFVRRLIGRSKRVFDALMLLMDATGLGIFTITGINTAITLADCTDPLLLVFVGLLTGTGRPACCATCSPEICPTSCANTSTPAPPSRAASSTCSCGRCGRDRARS